MLFQNSVPAMLPVQAETLNCINSGDYFEGEKCDNKKGKCIFQ
jgi:hypothetical protein